MKRNRQNILGLWLVALFLLLSAGASAQGVVIYRKGGTPIKVPYAELDSISTYDYDEEPTIGPSSDDPSTDPSDDPSTDSDKPIVNPQTDEHEYVDLGLSVKWATCNVGASSPEEYGDYYAWGETETKSTYSWNTYKWGNSSSTLTKYCTSSSYGTVDNKKVQESSDDVAQVKWGGSWRMPTDVEMTELRENCTWTWTTQNGYFGYKVTSKTNGNSIFLPAAGYHYDSSFYPGGLRGYYWSSSLNTNYPSNAWYVFFSSSGVSKDSYSRRYGLYVRPVCP